MTTKWDKMSNDEKIDFAKRHGLSTHPDNLNVVDAAEADIEYIRDVGLVGIDDGDLDWLISPLTELGETALLIQIEFIKTVYDI